MAKGFTLIEVIIALALTILLVCGLAVFLQTTVRLNQQFDRVEQVQTVGEDVSAYLTQTIINSYGVTTPAASSTGSTLIMNRNLGGTIIETITLSGGRLYSTTTGGSVVAMTPIGMTVSGLSFTNAVPSGQLSAIRLTFTVTKETYTKTFYAAATVR